MAKKKETGQAIRLGGFSRVQLKEDGKIVGDSGWVGPNMITNTGIQNFILGLIGAQANSSQVGGIAVGTGGYPASDATAIPNEYGGTAKRKSVAYATTQRTNSSGTATLQFSASWDSTDNAGVSTINNVGLYNVTNAAGNLFCGNTYTASSWSTNQQLYATYQIQLSFTG